MSQFDIKSPAFEQAELRSECARVGAVLAVLGGLLALALVRGVASLAQGRRGEVWPFVLLLAVMIGYEATRLRYVRGAIRSGRSVSRGTWISTVVIETSLPTVALFLQIHTPFVGPERALVSPAVLAYFLFIVLSTLHLDSGLARLAGICSAAGYTLASVYVFLAFPQAPGGEMLGYATSFSYAALLLLGGFAAGSVANQIRLHVLAALRDAENQAKVAQLEHDLGVARSIQQGLLPAAPPQVEGFEIAGWNRPADQTGGDYFDWQQLEDGRIVLTVADVTGHGIGPALCMAACRAYARAIFSAQADLRAAFRRLNELLYEDLPSERFVTLAAGVLEPVLRRHVVEQRAVPCRDQLQCRRRTGSAATTPKAFRSGLSRTPPIPVHRLCGLPLATFSCWLPMASSSGRTPRTSSSAWLGSRTRLKQAGNVPRQRSFPCSIRRSWNSRAPRPRMTISRPW